MVNAETGAGNLDLRFLLTPGFANSAISNTVNPSDRGSTFKASLFAERYLLGGRFTHMPK